MDPIVTPMLGREVIFRGEPGVVVKWEPYGPLGSCDTLLQFKDSLVWVSSHELKPADDKRPLPCRITACRDNALKTIALLESDSLRCDTKPYVGSRIVKQAIAGALEDARRDVEFFNTILGSRA